MNLENYEFYSDEEKRISDGFLSKGYCIFDIAEKEALLELRRLVVRTCCEVGGIEPSASDDTFLNDFHKRIELKDLNRIRLGVYEELNSKAWFRPLYYSFGKRYIEAIVGNELAMQNRINLSIQFPHDSSSLLPIHCDFFSGESPFQAVLWIPLVDVHDTKSMFILSPDKNKRIIPRLSDFKDQGMSAVYDLVKDDVQFLPIPFGKGLIFCPTLLHGNTVNDEEETRWSFNVRFKSLFTPYNEVEGNEKKLGMFYLPVTTRPMTKVGSSTNIRKGSEHGMETQRQLQGYATVRKFNGFTFPIPMQNMLLREYCRKRGFLYILPPGEMQFENCYMLLNSAIRNLNQIPLVGMCSLFMLPPTPEHRFAIYERVFSARAEIHFLLENIVLRDPGDEMKVEELYCLQSAIAEAPKTLPLDHLGLDSVSASFCG